MKWKRYGPDALLFQFADRVDDEAFHRGRAISAELESNPPPGLKEFVSAFTTVLLEFDRRVVPDPAQFAAQLAARFDTVAATNVALPPPREIPVLYDGPDLTRVAEAHGLSTDDVCRLHTERIYKVYMLGFSPGFPYLGDLDPRLHTPRLPSPRLRVPRGSVAIGGEHTGIYTVESPGGWNIIGTTPIKIFDPLFETPDGATASVFLLKPGDRIQFVRVKDTASVT